MVLDATETYDGRITVVLLDSAAATERIAGSSYKSAIRTVKEHEQSVTASKIIDQDGDVVFASTEMDIGDWETEWEHAKRRLSVNVKEHDCPCNSRSCFADDLCVQCEMDEMQDQY